EAAPAPGRNQLSGEDPGAECGEVATPEHVGVAIRAIIFSGLLGGAAGTLALWGVRALKASEPVGVGPTASAPVFALLLFSILGAAALSTLGTWILTRQLISPWRRGGFSAIGGGAGLLLVFGAWIADNFGRQAGLLLYAGICVVLALL